MELFDFDVEIGKQSGDTYPVVGRAANGQVGRIDMRFPFGRLALDNRLKDLQIALLRAGRVRRRMLSPEEAAVQDFGQALFDALFAGEVHRVFAESQSRARDAGGGLRIRLRCQSPELAGLPWEFLYDTAKAEYLCLSTDTPLVRYVELPEATSPLRVAPPLRVLGMTANPTDLDQLDIATERQRIDDATAELQRDGLLELKWLDGQTWRHLQRALRPGGDQWHVFHFIGHGGFDTATGEGVVAFANDKDTTHLLIATDLGRLLGDHHSLRLVLLNSCEGGRADHLDVFSSTAATLVRRGTPAVVAMQYEITDDAAIEFARSFYESIVAGLPVDIALAESRKSVRISLSGSLEWGTPVLYTRASDGVLFAIDSTAAAPPRQAPVRRAPVRPPVPRVPTAAEQVDKTRPAKTQPKAQSKAQPKRLTRRRRPSPAPIEPRRSPVEPELVRIAAGRFQCGNTSEWWARLNTPLERDNQEPLRKVELAEFHIGRFPITNADFAEYVAATGARPPKHWEGAAPPAAEREHPVIWVSWYAANGYCKWLVSETGKAYRLPREWEKAARGTDARAYPWGDDFDFHRCHARGRSTRDVTAHSPDGDSPYGVADMVGNAREWAWPRDPIPSGSGPGRWGSITEKIRFAIARGGGYLGVPGVDMELRLTCTRRDEIGLAAKATVGFRLALSL